MVTDPTKTTYTDETGHEAGVCLCGGEASTHPHASASLEKCGDCYRNTCQDCRTWRKGAAICTKCAGAVSGRRTATKRKRSYASRSRLGRAKKRRAVTKNRRTKIVSITSHPKAKTVCPNCEQWQYPTRAGFMDCTSECARRGFAPKRQTK